MEHAVGRGGAVAGLCRYELGTVSLLTVRSICVVMAYLEPVNARAVSRIRCNGYLPLQGKLAFAQFCYLCVLVANAGNGNYSLKLLSLGTWSRSDYQRAEMAPSC